ncbi:hypothetical protein [Reyranella soli]|jgi:hypothetical protein|uniref:Uncharacterized protein n=1 Tax=Reyranella soli TaxID=1230389 RepID=A0A512N705_9HYPH|nr:hypothetical protein [Reyranella soli]GEP54758.1 hypothetical protein RSO01_19240 [Reyranella soli]
MPPSTPLNWVKSKTAGQVSEIAVLAPIKLGRIPGERRTYEERLRFSIDNLTARVQQGIPIELDRIRTIHFGRMIILRPEQYLVYSDVPGVQYDQTARGKVPKPFDDYVPLDAPAATPPTFRSWLLTLVEFDGDIRVYFRDIAQFIADDFDSLFRNCEDYGTTRNFEAFWSWIKRYQIDTNLFYSRYGDLTLVRIKQLQDFKRRFDEFVAEVRPANGSPGIPMDELFDQFLARTQQYAGDFPSPGGVYKSKS